MTATWSDNRDLIAAPYQQLANNNRTQNVITLAQHKNNVYKGYNYMRAPSYTLLLDSSFAQQSNTLRCEPNAAN